MAHRKPASLAPVPPLPELHPRTRLVLSRKIGETVEIGKNVSVRIQQIRGGKQVRLSIEAPSETPIKRGELVERTQ